MKAVLKYAPHETTERVDIAIAEIMSELSNDSINESNSSAFFLTKDNW